MATTTHLRSLGRLAHCSCCNAPIPPTDQCVVRDLSWEVVVAEEEPLDPYRFNPDAGPPGSTQATRYRREPRRATIYFSRECWAALGMGIVAYQTFRGLSDSPIANRKRRKHRIFEEAHALLKNTRAVESSTWTYENGTYSTAVVVRDGYTIPAQDLANRLAVAVPASRHQLSVCNSVWETIQGHGVPDRRECVKSYTGATAGPLTDCECRSYFERTGVHTEDCPCSADPVCTCGHRISDHPHQGATDPCELCTCKGWDRAPALPKCTCGHDLTFHAVYGAACDEEGCACEGWRPVGLSPTDPRLSPDSQWQPLSPSESDNSQGDNAEPEAGGPPHPAGTAELPDLVSVSADTVLTALQRVAPWLRRLDVVLNVGDNKPHLTAVADARAELSIQECALTLRAACRELDGWDEETVIGIVQETIPEQGFDDPWAADDGADGEVNMLDLPSSHRTGGILDGMRVVVRRGIWDALMGRRVQGDNRTARIVAQAGPTIARLGFQLRDVMDEPRVNVRCRYGRIVAYEPVTDHAVVQHDDGTMGHWHPGWLMPWNKPPPKPLSPNRGPEYTAGADTIVERLRQRRKRSLGVDR